MKELQRLAANAAQAARRPAAGAPPAASDAKAPAQAPAAPDAPPVGAHPMPAEGPDATLPIYCNPKPVLPFGPPAAAGHDTTEAPIFRDPSEETLPFKPPGGGVLWTTRRYAELVAELSVFEDRRAEILASRGLHSEADHRQLAAEWAARLYTDPHEKETFTKYCTMYREHFMQKIGHGPPRR